MSQTKHSLPSELSKDMKPCMHVFLCTDQKCHIHVHAVSTTNVHYSRPPKT